MKIISALLCFFVALTIFPCIIDIADADIEDIAGSEISVDTRPRAIVSMGDSYSSGEGILPFYGQGLLPSGKISNEDWIAHRSEKSWPGLLTLPYIDGTMAENHNTHWYFVAASGAVTSDINEGQKIVYNRDGYNQTITLSPQIEVFDKLDDKRIEYVTLTLGGNDMLFADIITEASLGGYFIEGTLEEKLEKVWDSFYNGGIREKIKQAYCDIYNRAKENNPAVKLIVAGYPTLIDKDGKGYQFTEEDASLINDSVRQFNIELEMLVDSCKKEGMRICFVSVEEEFLGKEAYSDTVETEYINRVHVLKQEYDIDLSGLGSHFSVHPNENGAKAYARCVQSKIDEIEKDGGKSEWPELFKENSETNILNAPTAEINRILTDIFGFTAKNIIEILFPATKK